MTVEEAATRLGCKPGLIYKLCKAGRLGHLRVGFGRGRVVIEERHIEDYRRSVEIFPFPEVKQDAPAARGKRPAVRDYVGEWERTRKGRRAS
jgi:excisionase family DNA binding protein